MVGLGPFGYFYGVMFPSLLLGYLLSASSTAIIPLTALHAAVNRSTKPPTAIADENRSMFETINSLRKDIDEQRKIIEEKNSALEEARTKNNALEDACDALKKDIGELRKELDEKNNART